MERNRLPGTTVEQTTALFHLPNLPSAGRPRSRSTFLQEDVIPDPSAPYHVDSHPHSPVSQYSGSAYSYPQPAPLFLSFTTPKGTIYGPRDRPSLGQPLPYLHHQSTLLDRSIEHKSAKRCRWPRSKRCGSIQNRTSVRNQGRCGRAEAAGMACRGPGLEMACEEGSKVGKWISTDWESQDKPIKCQTKGVHG